MLSDFFSKHLIQVIEKSVPLKLTFTHMIIKIIFKKIQVNDF